MSITDNYTPRISGLREVGGRAKWIRKCEHATLECRKFCNINKFPILLIPYNHDVFFTSFSEQPFPNYETGVFSCWICALLTWLFWLNSALKLKVLLHLTSLLLHLFREFLGKNGSTWDHWYTSALWHGTRHNTPAQLLRGVSCPRGVFWHTTQRCQPSQGTKQQRNSPGRCPQKSSKAVELLLLMLTF